jgi:hypothetical protein
MLLGHIRISVYVNSEADGVVILPYGRSTSVHLSEVGTFSTNNQVCVTLVSCNSMIIHTPVKYNADEYVCSDINDFIKMERHREDVIQNMIMTELKGYDKNIIVIQHNSEHG